MQWWGWLILFLLYVVLIVLLVLGLLSRKCPPPAPMDKFWVVDGWDQPK